MNSNLYPLLHAILDLDEAERLQIVGLLLDSLAESATVDREWLDDARRRYDAIRETLATTASAPAGTRSDFNA